MAHESLLEDLVEAFRMDLLSAALVTAAVVDIVQEEEVSAARLSLQDLFDRYEESGVGWDDDPPLLLAEYARRSCAGGTITWSQAIELAKQVLDWQVGAPAAALTALRMARELTPEGARLQQRATY